MKTIIIIKAISLLCALFSLYNLVYGGVLILEMFIDDMKKRKEKKLKSKNKETIDEIRNPKT